MQVEIKIEKAAAVPYAVIYTDTITPEVQRAAVLLEGAGDNKLVVEQQERLVILRPEEIFLVRVENEKPVVYTRDNRYLSGKRLYELESALGDDFLRINKSALVNLRQLDYVEPTLGGLMLLVLKNGARDHISRKYLPAFKQYLGV